MDLQSETAAKRWADRLWLAWALLLWLVPVSLFGQAAGTVNAVFNLQDFIGDPQAVMRLTMTPIKPPRAVNMALNGTNLLIPVENSRVTGLNGSVTFSNVATGHYYRMQLWIQGSVQLWNEGESEPAGAVVAWTNYFGTNLTGTVQANLYCGGNGAYMLTLLSISNSVVPTLEDTGTGLYRQLEVFNDNGVDVLQIGDVTQYPGTVTATWALTDYLTDVQAVQRLILQPLAPWGGVGALWTNLLVPARNSRPTGLTGAVTISNVVTGYAFRMALQDQAAHTVGLWTNAIPTWLTGVVNANAYVGSGSIVATGTTNTFGFMALGGNFVPMLLDTYTQLWHQVFIYEDQGVPVLQLADQGFANPPLTEIAPPAGSLFRYFNVGGMNAPQIEDVTTSLYHTVAIYNDAGAPELQLSDQGY